MSFDIHTILRFLEGDFESTWNALAAIKSQDAYRGNFLFARQAFTYLEVVCRLCSEDKEAMEAFALALNRKDANYFLRLPGGGRKATAEFSLPTTSGEPEKELLSVLFDLVRNGQAHQGQQITAVLGDGVNFMVGLSGAQPGAFLGEATKNGRPSDHLQAGATPDGTLFVNVRTEVLFLDLKAAAREAQLFVRGLEFKPLQRRYVFTSAELRLALKLPAPGDAG